jgi:flagellar biosynthesis anti-sigma factor FlgM
MSDIVSLSGLSNVASGSQVQVEHSRAANEPASAGPSGSVAAPGSSEDSIVLSTAARLVQQAWSAGAADRASRVQQLKQQVESGEYSIDPAAIGCALIGATIAGE